jgi:hypothetical protein
MAKKTIFIGNQSNDGTGDSIRDAFDKVNQNFNELYSINNAGGGLFFTKLDDTPNSLIPDAVLINSSANTVTQKVLVAGTGISIVTTATGIVLSNTNSSLFTDPSPRLSADLDGNNFQANNFADPLSNQDLATKKYVDDNGFASSVNIYVSWQSGNDSRTGSKAGRALAYAFKTINKACQVAEQLINDSSIELGPDQKYITYDGSFNNKSTIQSITDSTDIPGNKVIGVNFNSGGTDPWLANDIRPGQYIIGMISGAAGFIKALKQEGGLEKYDVTVRPDPLVPAGFQLGEPLMYGSTIAKTNISILVESGIYEEQLPIRIPANVSIRGDEFRRVIVRPAAGASTSPWVKVWFRRDETFDDLTIASQKFGYHYLSDPNDVNSLPKENKDIDVFLMNDQTILRALSAQGHGGFMCVLDPEGQILTKSPYIQNCSSISRSINDQIFAGGMYIDGFAGNLEANSTSAGTYFTGTTTIHVTGLTKRVPQTPCAFVNNGISYEINYVTNWDQNTGDADLHFNPRNPGGIAVPNGVIDVNSGTGYTTVPVVRFSPPSTPGGVVAQGTAIKDIDGVITQINLTNPGSGYTSAPTITFVGGDPLVPATATLSDSDIKSGFIGEVPSTLEIGTAGYKSALAADFTQLNDLGYGVVVTNLAFSELVSVFTYFCHAGYYAANGAQIGSSNGATKYGDYALISEGSDQFEVPIPASLLNDMITTATVISQADVWGKDTVNDVDGTTLFVQGWSYVPYNQSLLEVDHGAAVDVNGRTIGRATYTINNASTITNTGTVVQLNLSTAGGSLGALKAAIPDGTNVIIRSNKTFGLAGVNTDTITRPSTALDFLESSSINYPILRYETTDSVNGIVNATFKQPFKYIRLVPNPDFPLPISGADTIHIKDLTQYSPTQDYVSESERLVNSVSGDAVDRYIFGWNNQIHEITGYTPYSLTNTGTISIDPPLNLDITTSTVTLYAGLQATQPAQIATRISLLRATGHDFVGVGAGGRETANIPNDIYGPPRKTPNQAFEVTELGRGRVFHTSTDQDGNFRVGDLFEINQGTGAATLNASITLTGVEGLGFTRGVIVDEFSIDDNMNPASSYVVPVQSAIVSHISRRLGLSANGDAVPKIGSGYLDLTGLQKMTGNLQLNGNSIDMDYAKVINLSTATSNFDATNKGQVDAGLALKVAKAGDTMSGDLYLSSDITFTDPALKAVSKRSVDKIRQIAAMSDVTLTSVADTDFLMFAGTLTVNTATSTPIWTNGRTIINVANSSTSNISVTRSGNAVAFAIKADNITNSMIKSDAAIDQSKLSMNAATTRATSSGITQSELGLASFDSGFFATSDGWVSVASPGTNKVLTSDGSGAVTWSEFSNVAPSSITGNAATATRLETARNINGIAFDGTASITINLVNTLSRGSYLTGNNFNGSTATTWAVDVGTVTSPTANKVVARNSNGDVWANIFNGTATSAQYADLAEKYSSDTDYEPGTVVVFGGVKEITKSIKYMDNKVAGVISTNPAHLMNAETEGLPLALQGRVPCKVVGKINKGDMMVTSTIPGVATSCEDPKMGTVIGKALEDYNSPDVGIIEVVVGRL